MSESASWSESLTQQFFRLRLQTRPTTGRLEPEKGPAGLSRPVRRRTVFAWLTRDNTRRRHSANGHLSPDEYDTDTTPHHTPKLTLTA